MAGGQEAVPSAVVTGLSTEVFDPALNYWRIIEAKLPGPKHGLRMFTTFSDQVFIFGIYIFWISSCLHI